MAAMGIKYSCWWFLRNADSFPTQEINNGWAGTDEISKPLYLRRVTSLFRARRKINNCILRARGKIWRCIFSNQTHLLLWPRFLILLTLTVPHSPWDFFFLLLLLGSSSAKMTHKFIVPDELGWDTRSFQTEWEEVDNMYINQSLISYWGSLPLLQLGQTQDLVHERFWWVGCLFNGPRSSLSAGTSSVRYLMTATKHFGNLEYTTSEKSCRLASYAVPWTKIRSEDVSRAGVPRSLK